jgi:hypothetical protein
VSNIGELWNFLTNAKIVTRVSSKPVILAGPVQTGWQARRTTTLRLTAPARSGEKRQIADNLQSMLRSRADMAGGAVR